MKWKSAWSLKMGVISKSPNEAIATKANLMAETAESRFWLFDHDFFRSEIVHASKSQ
jgi:hypothetical protein